MSVYPFMYVIYLFVLIGMVHRSSFIVRHVLSRGSGLASEYQVLLFGIAR